MCKTSHEKLTVCEGQGCLKEKGEGEIRVGGGSARGKQCSGEIGEYPEVL